MRSTIRLGNSADAPFPISFEGEDFLRQLKPSIRIDLFLFWARHLNIGYSTVDTHVAHIYEKLNVTNAPSAVNRAHRLGLFPPEDGESYNFEWDESIYDSADWSGREAGKPFFMQVQLAGGKLRGGTDDSAKQLLGRAKEEFVNSTDPDTVTLPPYYQRVPVLLRDWAAYLDSVRFTDKHVGDVVARLEKEGILDNTLIIFMTDHGISHARGKQFLYNEGTHIPFIVRGPGIAAGQVREDLIEHIDMAAISARVTRWLRRTSRS